MTKIFELLKNLAPEGVLKRSLWEVTIWDKKFNGVEKSKQKTNIEFRHVSAELLKTMSNVGQVKLLSTGNFEGWTTEEIAGNYLNNSEVISIPSGGTANIKYYSGKFVDSGNILAVSSDKNSFSLKYVYYWLLDNNSIIQNYFRGSGVKHPDMKGILELMIPIPPLEIQNEIVRILDNFSKLEAELEAELEARKKQYNYYSDKKLNFDTIKSESKIFVPIQDVIVSLKTGLNPRSNFSLNTADALNYYVTIKEMDGKNLIFSDKTDKVNNVALKLINARSNLEKNDILFSGTGTIGVTYLINETPKNWNIKEGIYVIKPNMNKIHPNYLVHILNSNYFKKQYVSKIAGSAVVSLPMRDFRNILVPVPSIEMQIYIARKLDSFRSLIMDLSEGLPAEIKARKQQYEYFRNKLLNFKERQ